MGMILTDEQQAILDGAKGETMAKVMKTLVMFGEAFHAEKMVPVTSRYNHLVTSCDALRSTLFSGQAISITCSTISCSS